MKEFAQKVLSNLEANGFPNKKVSLPTDKMFEIADNKGFSFNSVLDYLKNEFQIEAEIGTEKIIFSKIQEQLDQAAMMQKAQEMMSKMSPDELKQMQDMFMNMSAEEKADIMKKGKDMGLI